MGRPGKALLAAAAIAGVLLVSVPFLIAVGDDSRPGASEAPGTVLGGGGTDAPGTFSAASPDARQGGGPKAGGATAPGSGAEASGRGPDEVGLTAGGDTPENEAKGGAGEAGTTTAPASTADKSAPSRNSGTSSPPPKAPAASALVYTGVVGHGCPTPSGGGYKQVNYFSDGTAGWYTRTTGAWTGDGCNGSYAAVPMSGSTSTDGESRVMWWWRPGTEARTCQISVFIPHSNTTLYVGGHPSTYHVLVDANDRTTKYSSFTVNQAGLRGQWIGVGTFPVKGSTIGVKLLDRGDDWSDGWGKAHHAAAQMKATCRS
ncbi:MULTISPECIES: adhesin [Streptomyces]|uniref:Adhesin n=1 Tax=Streptomyces glycanivorans TaxID=3033808 RepID=A0ABY9JFB0_9ACTN|nr:MULTISPECIES: adhesin [unclassified Streptomyces]WSQ79892.1 adhesin [Streptomyces sp. NBC_01213]TXS08961.1 adhesin [Streptomyces sp. wa22]WLQ66442.1 adhesin [Streptomyces sp. Alt3]WSQ87273.1 adhesin [Streptomyces sp. NBC_01212]WSR06711.1 adhesin [Streptomyces sp. NBC_01208]